MTKREWKLGDRLMHAGRPEWGVGEVRSAESTVSEGVKSQRLTVRFERAGVKTLATAFADLRPADEMPQVPDAPVSVNGHDDADWLKKAEAGSTDEMMIQVPEAATDPFRTLKARLEATLALYRFTGGGASLLDWAAMQSGLKDPLSRFTRHDLEQLFDRFRNALDTHLKRLVLDLKKADPAALTEVASAASPAAKQALRRADGGR